MRPLQPQSDLINVIANELLLLDELDRNSNLAKVKVRDRTQPVFDRIQTHVKFMSQNRYEKYDNYQSNLSPMKEKYDNCMRNQFQLSDNESAMIEILTKCTCRFYQLIEDGPLGELKHWATGC